MKALRMAHLTGAARRLAAACERAPERPFLLAVFLAACALVVSRRPDALLNPQFYFEDGAYWYADAHNLGGFQALLLTYRGYFSFIQRLGGLLALAVPLAWAPLVFNLIALVVESLPAIVLASRRFAPLVPRREARLGLAFLYVATPGIWGTILNLTHAQWHLATLSCLVVLAAPAPNRAWRAFDVTALVISGLTGPTCLFLAPIAAIVWYSRRDRWSGVLLALVAATACVQAACLYFVAPPIESHAPLGASLPLFLRLVAQRLIYAVFLGQHASAGLLAQGAGALSTSIAVVAAAATGLAILAYAVLRGPLELKLFIAFGAAVLGSALCWPVPMSSTAIGYWETLILPGAHTRYFYTLTLALIVTLVWMFARAGSRFARGLGAIGLAVAILCAVRVDWREPPYRDFRFEEYVEKYDRAAPGERVQIPTPPGWSMILTKR